MGGRERGFGRLRVADLPPERDVVRHVVPDRRSFRGLVAGGDGGEGLVVDVDALARVEGLPAGLGDDEGDALADEADPIGDEGGLAPFAEAIAFPDPRPRGLRRSRHRGDLADPGPREVRPGVYGLHPRRRPRRRRLDAANPCVREWRAENYRVQGARRRPVVDETPLAPQQPRILAAKDGLAHPESAHGAASSLTRLDERGKGVVRQPPSKRRRTRRRASTPAAWRR